MMIYMLLLPMLLVVGYIVIAECRNGPLSGITWMGNANG